MTDKRYTAKQLLAEANFAEVRGDGSITAQMLRQAAEDCEDAERYRWLRNEAKPGEGPCPALRCQDGPYFNSPISGERLDRAIDKARTQEKAND